MILAGGEWSLDGTELALDELQAVHDGVDRFLVQFKDDALL